MRSPFLRTLTAIDADSGRFSRMLLTAGGLILLAWSAWAVWGSLPLRVVSRGARIEWAGGVQVLRAADAGHVAVSRLVPSSSWNPGDTLLVLDNHSERAAWMATGLRIAALERRRLAIRRQCLALVAGVALARSAAAGDSGESQARVAEAEIAARGAERESRRMTALHREGLVADAAQDRALDDAERLRAEARATDAGRTRGVAERLRTAALAEHALASAQGDLAEVEGELADAAAASAGAEARLSRRAILATSRCQVVRVAPLRAGTFVAAGDTLAWLSPIGIPTVRAEYLPSDAVGRIELGQPARVRSESYAAGGEHTWSARVVGMAPEPEAGTVRIDLALDGARSKADIPYGLPLIVEVTVGRGTPFELLLFGARRRLGGGTAAPSRQ